MQPKVILICGPGRSGSTLLDRTLGQCDDFFSVGELMYIWQRGLTENQLCGCGEAFKSCEFWTSVIKEAFGELDELPLKEILRLQRGVARVRTIITKPYHSRHRQFLVDFERYVSTVEQLYAAIKKICGCSVIVDSSKEPSHLAILRELKNINLHVIHLVRDSRAVAYSWQKKNVKNPAVYWKDDYLSSGLVRSALEWDLHHVVTSLLNDRKLPHRLLRYEDMAADLYDTLTNVLEDFDIDSRNLSELFDETTRSISFDKINHTVSGNPMRFKYGKTIVQPDLEWKKNMKPSQKFVIVALTWPLLLRYGYL